MAGPWDALGQGLTAAGENLRARRERELERERLLESLKREDERNRLSGLGVGVQQAAQAEDIRQFDLGAPGRQAQIDMWGKEETPEQRRDRELAVAGLRGQAEPTTPPKKLYINPATGQFDYTVLGDELSRSRRALYGDKSIGEMTPEERMNLSNEIAGAYGNEKPPQEIAKDIENYMTVMWELEKAGAPSDSAGLALPDSIKAAIDRMLSDPAYAIRGELNASAALSLASSLLPTLGTAVGMLGNPAVVVGAIAAYIMTRPRQAPPGSINPTVPPGLNGPTLPPNIPRQPPSAAPSPLNLRIGPGAVNPAYVPYDPASRLQQGLQQRIGVPRG